MKIQEAIALIEPGILSEDKPRHWADLGCGNGTFTYALAHLLSPGSSIIAVDSLPQKLNKTAGHNVSTQFQLADISLESLTLPKLDGILMANSFHYIQQKEMLVKDWSHTSTQKNNSLSLNMNPIPQIGGSPFLLHSAN